jgi:hypothetical protein
MKDRARLQPEQSRPSPPWAWAATMKEPVTHRDEAQDERAQVRVGMHANHAPVVTGAAQRAIMTRSRAVRGAPAILAAVLAVLLGACSADPDTTGSSMTGESGSAASKDPVGPEPTATVFDPDEPTLPGGVSVLSHADTDDVVALDAGRYGIWVSDSLLYQVDVPAASEVFDGVYLNPGSVASGRNGIVHMEVADDDTALPVHPCRDHSPIPVGPTVADLATALSKQPFLTVTRPTEVTVGGMKGLLVKATVPKEADMSACQDNTVDLISGSYSAEAGIVQRMWILDVDGARHVIHAKVDANDINANQHTKAMIRMVESITFNHR